MKLHLKLFAVAKQLAGTDLLEVDLPRGATVGQLRDCVAATTPALAPLLPGMTFAVNAEYANDRTVLRLDDDIACIPPVSGW